MNDYIRCAERIGELLRDSKTPDGYGTFRDVIIAELKQELTAFAKMIVRECNGARDIRLRQR